jgi:hypothetical protein
MNVLPLIAREFRAQSRRRINYWLRVLAAAAMLSVFASFMLTHLLPLSQLGAALFAHLHQTLFFGFWLVVPLMTADCISREKREGTLGLLFLTPLTVPDLITAKVTVHVLQALSLFLAVLPILVLPFVLGGIGWPLVVTAVVHQASAVLLGIAAGLYASVKGGTATQVMVRAEVYAALLALFSCNVTGDLSGAMGLAPSLVVMKLLFRAVFCGVFFLVVFHLARQHLQETWCEEEAAPEQPQWVELFSDSEFWQTLFHWDRSRTMDRNPMAWLQEYSWTARLTKWGWFALFMLIELFVLGAWDYRAFAGWQPTLTMVLALGVAFSAVGSFRREQQTGLLEIMLVTPLSARQLIGGRLWGIFCHYFPALAVLLVGWYGDLRLNPQAYTDGFLPLLIPSPLAFLALGLVGLYLSLGRLHVLLAWIINWVVAFLLPTFATVALGRYTPLGTFAAVTLASVLQLLLALAAWFLLLRAVRLRLFLRADPG